MAPLPTIYPVQVRPLLEAALREDLGRAGDRTADAVVPAGTRARARLTARSPGVAAGVAVAAEVFRLLDPAVEITFATRDGRRLEKDADVLSIAGDARAVLAAERTALNVLGHLCGIATATAGVVESVRGTRAKVVCTRKTTPLMRGLEKYAVRCGGGANHRFGLDDAVLIKDNHRAIAGSATEAVRRARAANGHLVKVEIEVDDLEELADLLTLGVDAVLLDNMAPDDLRQAVAIDRRVTGRRTVLEASGGIAPATARAVAETGVDLLSVGWLTHSAPVLDLGLDLLSD